MKNYIFYTLIISTLISTFAYSQKLNSLNKQADNSSFNSYTVTKFNINNISTFIYSNGEMDQKPIGVSGFEYPKGSGKTAIYSSGLIWGCEIDGKIHVGGSTYAQGLQPGRILADGTPQNPEEESARIYRVRPDYSYGDLSVETKDENISYAVVYNNYQKDWIEWPANWGAPFNDLDENGIYDPAIDIPGVPGAHQTIWYVANDFDTAQCRSLYGSDPINVEFQVTIWGYNIPQTVYDNVIFKKYKIINKNNVDIKEMHISQFADIDLGYASDDFVGCDILLNLMYSYNGDDDDNTYGQTIPAIGYQLLQGPLVVGEQNDKAYYNNSSWKGYKNLDMKSHYFFINGDPVYHDPVIGNYSTGTLQFYSLFRGFFPIYEPVYFDSPRFYLSGNPFTAEGWVDGILHPPGDRRNGFTTGTFELAVGDTQEVVIAQFAAMGTDRLNSLLVLKEYASKLQSDYPEYGDLSLSPIFNKINKLKPSLKQNIYTEYDIIELNIEREDSIENFSGENFDFQGYNIYQFQQESDLIRAAKNIFTFDKIDNITTINGDRYDPILSTISNEIIYKGSNSGIKNKIIIDKDYLNNSKFIKGKTYYYGITAYLYNEQLDKTIETDPGLLKIVVQEDLAGAKYSDVIKPTVIIGNSDAQFIIEVVDPMELTGNTYEVIFAEQHYYLDSDGEWKKTNYPDSVGNSLNKPNDQSQSKLIPMPSIVTSNSTLDLHFIVENNAPDNNNIDAISITFPEGIIINSANEINSKHYALPIIEGQTITWKDYWAVSSGTPSADGPFIGGEDLNVNINYVDPTFTIEYVIYDDGWSENYRSIDSSFYNLGRGTVDGYGTITLTGKIGYQFKTVPYWQLIDKTKNEVKLEFQDLTIYPNDWYGDRFASGPKSIVDGFSIQLYGSVFTPIDFSNLELNEESTSILTSSSNRENLDIQNYSIFGGVINSRALDNFGVGTPDIDILEQDYELRFTGVYDNGTRVDSQTVYKIIEGGSVATCFRMINRDALATNPLNPNPGTAAPFLVRIPFEVWNREDPNNKFQVNLAFRDRMRNGSENPFWAWNPSNRMYPIIVNSPYSPNQVIQVDGGPDEFNALATWVLVFYGTNYHLGDTIKITYPNPIEIGDAFTFTTPKAPTDKISPNEYALFQNYPNPFNPNTKIRYFIPEDGNVKITIYNVLGQKVTEVINKNLKAGKYETEFNGSNFASGVYIYRIDIDSPSKANIYSQTKKMLLLK